MGNCWYLLKRTLASVSVHRWANWSLEEGQWHCKSRAKLWQSPWSNFINAADGIVTVHPQSVRLQAQKEKKRKSKERIQGPWRQEMLAILFTDSPLHLNSYNSPQHRMGSQSAIESPQKGLQSLGSCSRTQQPRMDVWPTCRGSAMTNALPAISPRHGWCL